MVKIRLLALLILFSSYSFGQTLIYTRPVRGNLFLPPGTPASNSKMRFQLKYCGGQNGRVPVNAGNPPGPTGIIVGAAPFDVNVASDGSWQTQVYGNDQIVCGNDYSGPSRWLLQPVFNGEAGSGTEYQIQSCGATSPCQPFSPDTAVACGSPNPNPPPPTIIKDCALGNTNPDAPDTTVTVNATMAVPNAINFGNVLLPPANGTAINFLLNGNQAGAYLPGNGNSSTCLSGTGTWVLCGSGGSGGGGVSGATSGGGLVLTGTTLGLLRTCSTNQSLSWNGAAWVCTTLGGGGGGGGLPTTPQWDLFGSTGVGGAQASGILGGNGFLKGQVMLATGDVTSAPAPFPLAPNASVEYFPLGASFGGISLGTTNGLAAYFSHSGKLGAAPGWGNGGVMLGGGNSSGTNYQVYVDCESAPLGCDFKVPVTVNGNAVGGGGGGGSLPTIPAPNLWASNGTGGANDSGVLAQSGFLRGFVLEATGTGTASPFTVPNASIEYFPSGATYGGINIGALNGVAIHFSHSGKTTGSAGNGGVALGGANATGTGSTYQIFVDCEQVGCDFKVPVTYLGNALGGGGGGGSGTVSSGTINYFASYTGTTTVSSNPHLDDGATTAGTITSTEPIAFNTAAGAGISMTGNGGTLPAPVAGAGGIGIGPSGIPEYYSSGGAWTAIGSGGGGGSTLPTIPQWNLFASNGLGVAVDSGVLGESGFLRAFVLEATGTGNASPFSVPNGSIEYFPTGATYGGLTIGATNGVAIQFSHSSKTNTAGNGGVALAGGNSSGTGSTYQIFLDCEQVGCDFKVPLTQNGNPIGGGGGGGSGTVSTGTVNRFASYTGTTTVASNAHLDDGLTNAGEITSTEPIVAPSFIVSGTSGNGSAITGPGGTLPALTPPNGGIGIGPGGVPQYNSAGAGWVAIGSGGGGITGATANGGLQVSGTTLGMITTCTANQYLSWSGTAWSCTSLNPTSINGTAGAFTFTGAGVSCSGLTCTFSGGGSGGATVPNTLNVLAGNNTGGILATGVNAQSGYLQGGMLSATGTAASSPYTGPNASMEYYGPGTAYGISAPNGASALFSHSASTAGSTGNAGVLLGGGNATAGGYQVYLNCQMAGCDFGVPMTVQGSAVGGVSHVGAGVVGQLGGYNTTSSVQGADSFYSVGSTAPTLPAGGTGGFALAAGGIPQIFSGNSTGSGWVRLNSIVNVGGTTIINPGVNLSNTQPSLPANSIGVTWNASQSGATTANARGYILGDGVATDCLVGTGVFSPCPGSGGGITGATTGGGLVATGATLGMLTSCTANQYLSWSGSAWVCTTLSVGGGSGTVGTGTSGQYGLYNGATSIAGSPDLTLGPSPVVGSSTNAIIPAQPIALQTGTQGLMCTGATAGINTGTNAQPGQIGCLSNGTPGIQFTGSGGVLRALTTTSVNGSSGFIGTNQVNWSGTVANPPVCTAATPANGRCLAYVASGSSISSFLIGDGSTNCLNGQGNYVPCSGASGSGTVGTGTSGQIAVYNGATSVVGSAVLNDTGTLINSTEPITAPSIILPAAGEVQGTGGSPVPNTATGAVGILSGGLPAFSQNGGAFQAFKVTQVNGTPVAATNTVNNFSSTTAPTNGRSITFANSGSNITAALIGDGSANCLNGTGTYVGCGGTGTVGTGTSGQYALYNGANSVGGSSALTYGTSPVAGSATNSIYAVEPVALGTSQGIMCSGATAGLNTTANTTPGQLGCVGAGVPGIQYTGSGGLLKPITVLNLNGTSPSNNQVNLNGTSANPPVCTPAAPTNGRCITFQGNGSQYSAAIIGDGNSSDCLGGTGTYVPCGGTTAPVTCMLAADLLQFTARTNICTLTLPAIARQWVITCNIIWNMQTGGSGATTITSRLNLNNVPTSTSYFTTETWANAGPTFGNINVLAAAGDTVFNSTATNNTDLTIWSYVYRGTIAVPAAGETAIFSLQSSNGTGAVRLGSSCVAM